nr:hypothetical protein CFP56_71893 [Quercus suber]
MRCIPALSVLLLSYLLILSLVVAPYGKGERGKHDGSATIPQIILSIYLVFLYIMSIAFTARVCYAIGHVSKNLKESSRITDKPQGYSVQPIKTENGTTAIPAPLFVVILPAYKEEMETLEETLRVLGSHTQAHDCYHVYLAMEEKEEKAALKAAELIASFESLFHRMSFTLHPCGIPGEAQGKSSNESWAAKQALRDYADDVKSDIIITVMDGKLGSDQCPRLVAQSHLEHPDTNATTMYVPPLVFDRNLHRVPLLVRTADLMWAGAGISSLYSGSKVIIPTSVYSLPMTLVEHVGGWDTDPGAIGEDMHMYLKCFFALSGNLNVQVVYAAVSQCDVSSDLKGLSGYFDGLNARYKQALRHMWGSLDTGYTIRQSVEMFTRHRNASSTHPELPLSAPKYIYPIVILLMQGPFLTMRSSNWTAFYTSTGLHKSLHPGIPDQAAIPPTSINMSNLIILYQRIFEAHFLPIHLCIILTASGAYNLFVPSFLIPRALQIALEVSGWCRLLGFSLMLVFFYRYSKYHRFCVELRKEEMGRAGLLEDMVANDGFSNGVFQVIGLLETAIFPLGGIIFGAMPALQATFSHLFTDRLTSSGESSSNVMTRGGYETLRPLLAQSPSLFDGSPAFRLAPESKI